MYLPNLVAHLAVQFIRLENTLLLAVNPMALVLLIIRVKHPLAVNLSKALRTFSKASTRSSLHPLRQCSEATCERRISAKHWCRAIGKTRKD
jgi:hypothetical protein